MDEKLKKQKDLALDNTDSLNSFLRQRNDDLPADVQKALEEAIRASREVASQIQPDSGVAAKQESVNQMHRQLGAASDLISERLQEIRLASGNSADSNKKMEQSLIDANVLILKSSGDMHGGGLRDPIRNTKPKSGDELESYVAAVIQRADDRQRRVLGDRAPDVSGVASSIALIYDDKGQLNPDALASFNNSVENLRDSASNRLADIRNQMSVIQARQGGSQDGKEAGELQQQRKKLEQEQGAISEFNNELGRARDAAYKFAGIERPKKETPKPDKGDTTLSAQNRKGAFELILVMSSQQMDSLKIDGKSQSNINLMSAVGGFQNETTRKMFQEDLATINTTTFEIARGVKDYSADNFKPVVDAIGNIRTRAQAILGSADSNDPNVRDFFTDKDRESARRLLNEIEPMEKAIHGIRDGKVTAAGASKDNAFANLVPDDMKNKPRLAVVSADAAYLQAGSRGGSITRA